MGSSGIGITSVCLNSPPSPNNSFTVEKETTVFSNVVQIIKESQGGQHEKSTLVIRFAHGVDDSVRVVGTAGRLFPDQPGLQCYRRSHHDRHSALEPLGNFDFSW